MEQGEPQGKCEEGGLADVQRHGDKSNKAGASHRGGVCTLPMKLLGVPRTPLGDGVS